MPELNPYQAIDMLRQAVAERDSLKAEVNRLNNILTKIRHDLRSTDSPPLLLQGGTKGGLPQDDFPTPTAQQRTKGGSLNTDSPTRKKRTLSNNIDHLRNRMQQLLADGPINASQGIKLMDNDGARCNLLRKEFGILTTRLTRNLPGKVGKSCVWHYPHQHVDPNDDPAIYVRPTPPLLLQGGTKGGLPHADSLPPAKRGGIKGGDEPKIIILGEARKPCKIYKRPKSEVDAVIQQARERGDVTEKHLLGDNYKLSSPCEVGGDKGEVSD